MGIDGIKGSAYTSYKIEWGKWFAIGGIICALVVFIVSAWSGLFPKVDIVGWNTLTPDSGGSRYGDSITLMQGFYNLKFFTASKQGDFSDPGWLDPDAVVNQVSLSITGIVMIVFMILSVLLPLIGFLKAQNRLFIKSENGIFMSFLLFMITISVLMAIAVFVGRPETVRDQTNVFSNTYFNIGEGTIQWNESIPYMLSSLWLKPALNYWILFGLCIAGCIAIITFGALTSKKIFFRAAEHSAQHKTAKQPVVMETTTKEEIITTQRKNKQPVTIKAITTEETIKPIRKNK